MPRQFLFEALGPMRLQTGTADVVSATQTAMGSQVSVQYAYMDAKCTGNVSQADIQNRLLSSLDFRRLDNTEIHKHPIKLRIGYQITCRGPCDNIWESTRAEPCVKCMRGGSNTTAAHRLAQSVMQTVNATLYGFDQPVVLSKHGAQQLSAISEVTSSVAVPRVVLLQAL